MKTTLISRIYKTICTALLLITSVTITIAQDSNFVMPANLGIYGGLNINMNTPSFIFPIKPS